MLKHSTWQKNEKHTNQASDPKMYQKKRRNYRITKICREFTQKLTNTQTLLFFPYILS